MSSGRPILCFVTRGFPELYTASTSDCEPSSNSGKQSFTNFFTFEYTTCGPNRVLSGWCWDRVSWFGSSPRRLVICFCANLLYNTLQFSRCHRGGSRYVAEYDYLNRITITFHRSGQGPGGLRVHSAVSLLFAPQSFSPLSVACSNYEPGDEVSQLSLRSR